MAINNHIQFIRGSSTKNNSYTGLAGEITIDLEKDAENLRIHNGTKKGGIKLARQSEIPTKISQLENDLNYATTSGQIATASNATNATNDGKGNNIIATYAPIVTPVLKASTDNTVFPKSATPTNNADNSTNIATTAWVTTATSVVHTSGNETINGTKTFTSLIKGTAMNANWADLAEYYEADKTYPFGTLVQFGGEKEITLATDSVNAVVSRKPGFALNASEANVGNFLPIALCGRVEVLVEGKVNKFDKIVLGKDGTGKVDNTSTRPIAIALATKEDAVGLVLCATKFDF